MFGGLVSGFSVSLLSCHICLFQWNHVLTYNSWHDQKCLWICFFILNQVCYYPSAYPTTWTVYSSHNGYRFGWCWPQIQAATYRIPSEFFRKSDGSNRSRPSYTAAWGMLLSRGPYRDCAIRPVRSNILYYTMSVIAQWYLETHHNWTVSSASVTQFI